MSFYGILRCAQDERMGFRRFNGILRCAQDERRERVPRLPLRGGAVTAALAVTEGVSF